MAQNTNVVELQSRALHLLFSTIRNRDISVESYVAHTDRLVNILAEEGLAHLPMDNVDITTHCGTYKGVAGPKPNEICAVSIMRSGDILLEAVKRCSPGIGVGKILIQRDEEHPDKIAKLFYSKLPQDIKSRHVILCDPMLATGGSAICAIEVMINAGVPEEKIMFLNCVSCPEGIKALGAKYPKVQIVTAAIDEGLNEHKYIVPGLGDFGDRYYDT